MYIIIPQSEAATFKRTISRYESMEPVELSNGDYILPIDILNRLQELSERKDYQKMKAEYVTTLKSYLEQYLVVNFEEIKDLIKKSEI